MHVFMRYFSHSMVNFLAAATFVLFAAPLIASAQTGYGGGGGGISWGPGGYTQFTSVQFAAPQQGLVLGASTFNFSRTLSRGMEGLPGQGEDVTELQKILIAEGFLVLDAPTGYFGAQTEEALKAYQRAHGLEPIGIVGPLTRALLNARVAEPSLQYPSLSQTSSHNPLLPQLQLQLLNLLNQLRSMLSLR